MGPPPFHTILLGRPQRFVDDAGDGRFRIT